MGAAEVLLLQEYGSLDSCWDGMGLLIWGCGRRYLQTERGGAWCGVRWGETCRTEMPRSSRVAERLSSLPSVAILALLHDPTLHYQTTCYTDVTTLPRSSVYTCLVGIK